MRDRVCGRATQRRQRADPVKRERLLANRRRWYRENPDARESLCARNRDYKAAHPETSDVATRTYRRAWMRNRRLDPAYVARINARHRERQELKRRGLWPEVRHLPPELLPAPRPFRRSA